MTNINDLWRYKASLHLAVLCIVVFFVWASIAEVDQHVRGMGRIVPAGKMRAIQHLEGGIVQEILVKEGERVEQGQVLFQLANKRAETELEELKIAQKALELRAQRLMAEREGREEIDFDGHYSDEFSGIIESEKQLFESRRSAYMEKEAGLKKRMQQKYLKLDDLETNIKNLKEELVIAKEQLEIKKRLRNKEAISRSQYLETESRVKSFNTKISQVEKEIPIIKTELSEIANFLEEEKQNRFSEITDELNDVKIDMKKFAERISNYKDAVKRTAVRSPIKGVVNRLGINTLGGVIQAGETLAEIIPLEEVLIVEGRISTDNRGKIWPGLDVIAKITAYDYTIYGGIKGKLTYISADSFIDNSGAEYYQVRVVLDKITIGEDKPVFPGMSVDMNIIAGKISVLHAILRPLWNTRENALREL